MTPLLLASTTNRIEIVNLLINAGADVDITSQVACLQICGLWLIFQFGRIKIRACIT